MSNTRLTVVVRKDLQMPVGLLAAQVAHMADAFMRDRITNRNIEEQHDMTDKDVMTIPLLFKSHELEWMETPYLSVLAVNCYEDLVEVYQDVQAEKLPCHKWEDVIPSPTLEGKAIKAFIGIAIGPDDFDAIKIVTNGLELYK